MKLTSIEPLSNYAFNYNLCRYIMAPGMGIDLVGEINAGVVLDQAGPAG